jgi:hypothetical protein
MKVTWQQIGLALFVLTAVGTIVVLLLDWYWSATGRTTITSFCRANPWLAWLILWTDAGGLFGLAVHFMAVVAVDQD